LLAPWYLPQQARQPTGACPENQQRELEAVAERHGWKVVAIFTDAGISGIIEGRDKRPSYDGLCRGIARREFDQVSAWFVDRLGRSLQELVAFLGELHAKGVDLYIHQQGIDTARQPVRQCSK
jgi:DNA invertase Pin-like site-specific DNA recombinase